MAQASARNNPEETSASTTPSQEQPSAVPVHPRDQPLALELLHKTTEHTRATGPKTEAGKARSSRNALKHGALFTGADGPEDRRSKAKLLADLRNHLQPSNVVEDELVGRIAIAFWGQRMVQRATSGEVNKQRKTDMDPSRMEAVNVWLNMVLEREHRIANGTYSRLLSLTETQVIQQTRQTLRGIRLIRFYLNEIYQECQRAGAVSLAFADLLRCCCGSDADIILSSISLDAPNPPEQIAELLKRLEREDFSLQARANSLAEKAAVDALRFSVPERADLFIRYDRHYSNELYRALAELERQQRRRSGEVVPPPIKVDMMAGG